MWKTIVIKVLKYRAIKGVDTVLLKLKYRAIKVEILLEAIEKKGVAGAKTLYNTILYNKERGTRKKMAGKTGKKCRKKISS